MPAGTPTKKEQTRGRQPVTSEKTVRCNSPTKIFTFDRLRSFSKCMVHEKRQVSPSTMRLHGREIRESMLRGTVKKARSMIGRADRTEINLAFRPPYDWQTIIRFYMSHPIPGVERVTGDSFERVFRAGKTIGFFQVQAIVDEPQLKLRIVTSDPKIGFEVVRRVRKMFDLDSDPVLIANCLSRAPILAKLCERFPGLRLPRGWDAFETAI